MTTTARKGETKRQHYVPRFVLRKFSADGHRISLIVLEDGKRIDNAPLKQQCYADYFYGADNIMEKSFADEEAKVSRLLGDLSREHLESLTEEAIDPLRFFMAYQLARTKGAAERLNAFVDSMLKPAMKGTIALNKKSEVTPEDVDLVKIGYTEPQGEAIWQAAKSTPLFYDLAVKFITTDRTPGFVIADHPVVAYNQFAEHHDVLKRYPTSTGIALKGLQLFMPLSPSVVLAVFDPSVYEYGGKSLVCRAGPKDVEHLNQMQAVNAITCMYFSLARMTTEHLELVQRRRRAHPPMHQHKRWTSPITQRPDGKMSQFVVVTKTEVRIGGKLSFARVIDGHSYADYDGPAVPVRNPTLLAFAHEYGDFLEQQVAAAAKARPAEGASHERK